MAKKTIVDEQGNTYVQKKPWYKRAGCLVAVGVVVIIFASCSAALGGGSDKSDKTTKTRQPAVATVTKTIHGVTYKVPKAWAEKKGDSNTTYYYPKVGGTLMVQYVSIKSVITEKEARETFVKGMIGGFDKGKSSNEQRYGSTPAYEYDVTFDENSSPYTGKLVLANATATSDDEVKSGIIVFMIGLPTGKETKDLKLFDSMISGVQGVPEISKSSAESSSAPEKEESKPKTEDEQYQAILKEYTKKMKKQAPQLVDEYNRKAKSNTGGLNGLAKLSNAEIAKLAKTCNDGVSKMADVMLNSGSGDQDKYQKWAGKLQAVYQDQAQLITDAYQNSAQ